MTRFFPATSSFYIFAQVKRLFFDYRYTPSSGDMFRFGDRRPEDPRTPLPSSCEQSTPLVYAKCEGLRPEPSPFVVQTGRTSVFFEQQITCNEVPLRAAPFSSEFGRVAAMGPSPQEKSLHYSSPLFPLCFFFSERRPVSTIAACSWCFYFSVPPFPRFCNKRRWDSFCQVPSVTLDLIGRSKTHSFLDLLPSSRSFDYRRRSA